MADDIFKKLEQTGGFLLTDEDRVFAQEISDKFAIPFEEICIDLGMTRSWIKGDIETYGNLKEWNITEYQELKDSLVDIEAIHVMTSKGPVKFSKEDFYFRHFEKAINKVRASCDRIIHSPENPFSISLLNKLLRTAPLLAWLPSASKWNRLVIVGLFLVYFKIDPTIKSEEEWNRDRTEAQDYKHYLAETVKSRIKKLQ